MSGFIKEFYYGNIEPQEFSPELAAKLKSKLNALVEKEKALNSTLKGEDKDLFLKYVNAHNEFLSVSITNSFISGFRLGARFTYDTFVESNS